MTEYRKLYESLKARIEADIIRAQERVDWAKQMQKKGYLSNEQLEAEILKHYDALKARMEGPPINDELRARYDDLKAQVRRDTEGFESAEQSVAEAVGIGSGPEKKSRLRREGLDRARIDPGRALSLNPGDLPLGRGNGLRSRKYFDSGFRHIAPVDRKPHGSVPHLLERSRVGVVGPWLEPRDITVAQSGRVLPERECRKLIGPEPQHDRLVPLVISEHDERLSGATRLTVQLEIIDLLRKTWLRAIIHVMASEGLHRSRIARRHRLLRRHEPRQAPRNGGPKFQ